MREWELEIDLGQGSGVGNHAVNELRGIPRCRYGQRRAKWHAAAVANAASALPTPRRSHRKLLAEDAFFQIVFGIEQQRDLALGGFADRDFHHVADFM